MNDITDIRSHIRDRAYMSGVERDRARVKATGEVFTPTPLVQEILDQLDPGVFQDPQRTFLDPTCGDGQFLGEVVIRKLEHGSTLTQALSTTHGVDLMPDNCRECIRRIYMCEDSDIVSLDREQCAQHYPDYQWSPGLREVYAVNTAHYQGIARVVCADGLAYDYCFGEEAELEDLAPTARRTAPRRAAKTRIDPRSQSVFSGLDSG